jgi:hypothetical protein
MPCLPGADALARSIRMSRGRINSADITLAGEEIERGLADAGHLLRAVRLLAAEDAPDFEAMAAVAVQAEVVIDAVTRAMRDLTRSLVCER